MALSSPWQLTPTKDRAQAQQPFSLSLKAAIFATGLAGVVAEYVLATLASYLLGNTLVQWTLTISFMLFAMGIGSRLSQHVRWPLLDTFIAVELLLSFLCALSAQAVYGLAAHVPDITLFIYGLTLSIGLLIGLEIPLVTRINEVFEELKVNISGVMEKDYYGALVGGLLFAFVALPKLGMTYTPLLLGTINFAVAGVLFWRCRALLRWGRQLTLAGGLVMVLLVTLALSARSVHLYGEQNKYRDQVVYLDQSPYQRIVLTQWQENFWFYLNGNIQFSSYDEERYHEPLVHPLMQSIANRSSILILGGGDGLALREVLKYSEVRRVDLVDLDPAVTTLGVQHPLFTRLNKGALNDPRVSVINDDGYRFLRQTDRFYDAILIDLPDPKTIHLTRLYTRQFYQLVKAHLSPGGGMVTQATSPFFAPQAFISILKTVTAGGFVTVPYHNHIPTMGEWGWVIGLNIPPGRTFDLKRHLLAQDYTQVETRFLNRDAMVAMLHFGKGLFDDETEVVVNDEFELTLYRYYRDGAWDLY